VSGGMLNPTLSLSQFNTACLISLSVYVALSELLTVTILYFVFFYTAQLHGSMKHRTRRLGLELGLTAPG